MSTSLPYSPSESDAGFQDSPSGLAAGSLPELVERLVENPDGQVSGGAMTAAVPFTPATHAVLPISRNPIQNSEATTAMA